jgi:hypothetical protein
VETLSAMGIDTPTSRQENETGSMDGVTTR